LGGVLVGIIKEILKVFGRFFEVFLVNLGNLCQFFG